MACAKQGTVVSFHLSASQPLLTLVSGEDIPKLFVMALEGGKIVFRPDCGHLPPRRCGALPMEPDVNIINGGIMRVRVVYQSTTGNTKKIAEVIARIGLRRGASERSDGERTGGHAVPGGQRSIPRTSTYQSRSSSKSSTPPSSNT